MAAECFTDDDVDMIVALWKELVHDVGADDVDQGLAADLTALGSTVAALMLQDPALPLSPESWQWVDGVALTARDAAEEMAAQEAGIQRALSLLSRWPPAAEFHEEAFLAALRRQAAYAAARREDAEEVAALTHMVREKELRRMMAAKERLLHPEAAAFLAAGETAGASEELMMRSLAAEHLVHPATAAFLGYIAGQMDASLAAGEALPAGDLALASQVEGMTVRMEEDMAALAGRLRRGAAQFQGDEELVAALHKQAATVDAARAAVEAFTASMRRIRAAAGSALMAPAGTGSSLCPKL